jgi:hypothetical protein
VARLQKSEAARHEAETERQELLHEMQILRMQKSVEKDLTERLQKSEEARHEADTERQELLREMQILRIKAASKASPSRMRSSMLHPFDPLHTPPESECFQTPPESECLSTPPESDEEEGREEDEGEGRVRQMRRSFYSPPRLRADRRNASVTPLNRQRSASVTPPRTSPGHHSDPIITTGSACRKSGVGSHAPPYSIPQAHPWHELLCTPSGDGCTAPLTRQRSVSTSCHSTPTPFVHPVTPIHSNDQQQIEGAKTAASSMWSTSSF